MYLKLQIEAAGNSTEQIYKVLGSLERPQSLCQQMVCPIWRDVCGVTSIVLSEIATESIVFLPPPPPPPPAAIKPLGVREEETRSLHRETWLNSLSVELAQFPSAASSLGPAFPPSPKPLLLIFLQAGSLHYFNLSCLEKFVKLYKVRCVESCKQLADIPSDHLRHWVGSSGQLQKNVGKKLSVSTKLRLRTLTTETKL